MKRILLSTATTPFPLQPWHDTATDRSRQRTVKGQGIFTNEGHEHLVGIFIIAQNISVPCTVLDHPTVDNWVEEIKKGYDYVGISALTPNLEGVLEMCRMVKKYSPQSQTVVGCFVAQSIEASYPKEEWSKLIDHLVVGDGVDWFRELVGDDLSAPIHQHYLPKCTSGVPRWLDRYPLGYVAPLIAALGCDKSCSFCATTSFYNHKRHQLITEEQIVEEIKRSQVTAPGTKYTIYEEDQDKDFMLRLGKALRADPEIDFTTFSLNILASISTLSQFEDLEELRYCNVGSLFVGLESKYAADQGNLRKSKGKDPKEIIHGLLARGVITNVGWMAGFDWHTREILEEDFQYLVECHPTTAQLTRVTPYPGTPLYNKLMREGRIDEHKWEDVNFYGGGMSHKHLTDHETMEFLRLADGRLFDAWGPTALRALNVQLNGYERYRNYDDKHFKQIAESHRMAAYNGYPWIYAVERFAPNGAVRRQVKVTEQRWKAHFGEPATDLKIEGRFREIKAAWATIKEQVEPANRFLPTIPAKRYHYFGADIKHDGSLPYEMEYLNEDPVYTRDLKVQGAERALLAVALAAGKALDNPDAPLHDTVKELRDDASAVFTDLANRLREPKLDVAGFLNDLRKGLVPLLSKAVAAGEKPGSEIADEVQEAKGKLADLLAFYATVVDGRFSVKRLITNPPLFGLIKKSIDGVRKAVAKKVGAA